MSSNFLPFSTIAFHAVRYDVILSTCQGISRHAIGLINAFEKQDISLMKPGLFNDPAFGQDKLRFPNAGRNMGTISKAFYFRI
jgi:hypothetical protein